jgi:predicted nucleic acid-binding protein
MKDIIREEKNTTVVSIQMLVRTATHNKRKKYGKIDDRIRQMVKDFNVVSREDYFKMARSVFNF